jgi:hypothetical protein
MICAIVIASFVTFAITQTKSASGHQTEAITGKPASASVTTGPKHEGTVHKTIEEASNTLTAPFAGVVSEADSEWASRGVKLLLALAVYGFGLGYLARVLRVRV